MSEMIKSEQNNNDEIDLIHVFERVFNFLSTYKKELLVSAIAGLLCGYILYRALPRSYGSSLILHSQVLTNSEEIEIIDNWNNLLKNGELGVLSSDLNCTVYVLSKVKHLSAKNVLNAPVSGASGFTVDASIKDTAMLEDLQKAIIYGLENNEFVKEKVIFRRDNTIKMIESINREISKLDSTKRRIEAGTYGKATGSSSLIVDISDVNVQMINLNEKLYLYQENLKFNDAIQVLQNFEKYSIPVSPRLSILLISGLLFGVFTGFALSFIKSIRLKIALVRKARLKQLSNQKMV